MNFLFQKIYGTLILIAAVIITLGFCAFWWLEHTKAEAVPTVTLPAELRAEAGEPVFLDAQTTQKVVRWHACGSVKLTVFADKKVQLWAKQPGRYDVYAVVASGSTPSEFAHCVFVVGQPGPTPPGPLPPGPTPEPSDPFYPTLKAAWQKDTKGKDAKGMAALYRQGTGDALQKATTAGDFTAKMHAAADYLVGTDGMVNTRRTLADELNKNIQVAATTPLTDALRGQFAAQMNRLATLLDALP